MTDIREYLQGDSATMQLATVRGGKPWVATVYFVVDNDLNVYWLSWPERRHSQELAANPDVAAAIVIKADQPVIGVQLAGRAAEVTDPALVRKMAEKYVTKYGQGERFYEAFAGGTNRHNMYRLCPTSIALFDEVEHMGESPVAILDQSIL